MSNSSKERPSPIDRITEAFSGVDPNRVSDLPTRALFRAIERGSFWDAAADLITQKQIESQK